MPFDGIVTKCVVRELDEAIVGGRIEKAFQPEADEIVLNIRAKGQNLKLVLSASPSYPRIHLTSAVKENPGTPPMFCMLLRKHLSGGRITGVLFHDYERMVTILVESVSELGDLSLKKLIIEIMGRHSNIILVNAEDKIIDSIKHVDNEVSSVREVMPARPYKLPPSQDKTSLETLDVDSFIRHTQDLEHEGSTVIEKYILNCLKGFSPLLCREVCRRAEIDGKTRLCDVDKNMYEKLGTVLKEIKQSLTASDFSPCIIYEDAGETKPVDFHCLELKQHMYVRYMPGMSQVLDLFYSVKDAAERLKQKKSDMHRVLNTNLERCRKKLALQEEKLRETADREKLKLFGELITANIYSIPANAASVSLLNYYSENGEYVDIPLDKNLLPQENAQSYFRQYSKAKSAYEYTSKQLKDTLAELDYLESIIQALEECSSLRDIEEIRQELVEQGYMRVRKKDVNKKQDKPSLPLRYKSSDGFEILAGKNNRQNDVLTMKTASSNDLWLHVRNMPGSHVIVRKRQKDIPDRTLLEAAILAAYHSRAKMSSNVPVDYTAVRNVKKPPGTRPGMVIYDNFKTLIVTPDESVVKRLKAF